MRAGVLGAIERIRTGGQDRIQVAEQNDGDRELRSRDELEHLVVCHSLSQRALGARLDHGPVRHGIGERNADFDDVGPRRLEGAQELQRARKIWMARGDVDDQGAATLPPQRREALDEWRRLR